MPGPLGTYSASDCIVIVDGKPLSGFSPDSIVTVEYNSAAATLTEGADGTPAVAFKRGMRGGSFKISLMQTSMDNGFLSALLQAQKFGTSNGVSASIAITSSGETHSMPRCFIEQEPSASYNSEIGTREWTLIGQMNSAYQGNVS